MARPSAGLRRQRNRRQSVMVAGFAGLVRTQLDAARTDLRAGEAKAVEALTGRASLQDVVEAVTEAELSLQKMTAVRDRVISAYQEIMRMPI
jgi:flagellar hook-basal body complex protein FliE